MGWVYEDVDSVQHEGYVVGLVHSHRADGTEIVGMYRELAYPLDDGRGVPVMRLQAGCDCGWRSPHWQPRGWWSRSPERWRKATWSPYSVIASDDDEERACELWRAHVAAEAAARRVEAVKNKPW